MTEQEDVVAMAQRLRDQGVFLQPVGDLLDIIVRLRKLLRKADEEVMRWSSAVTDGEHWRPLSVRDLHERIERELAGEEAGT